MGTKFTNERSQQCDIKVSCNSTGIEKPNKTRESERESQSEFILRRDKIDPQWETEEKK